MKEAKLEYVRIDENGLLRQDDIKNLLDKNPKLLAIIHCSNVLGTINDVKSICQQAHRKGTVVVVDAAQSVPHMQVDVQDIGCDFLVFSGHKMLGPMGIGVLYGKESLLDKMKPFMYGGDMIREVDLYETRFNGLPNKFEAGTPNVEGVIGLSVAIDYLDSIGMKNIREHEYELTKYALEKMRKIKGLRILGPTDPKLRLGVIAFTLEGIHPHDVGQIFDEEGLAVRSGTHCAIPLHKKFNVPASTRASFYVYNTKEDIDKMILAIEKSKKVFRL
jgi:cysteine desulfurase/selenocysteine lyase